VLRRGQACRRGAFTLTPPLSFFAQPLTQTVSHPRQTLTYGFMRQDNVEVRVARIFNTFGPRMNPYDGRVVSNFIIQALKGEDMTVCVPLSCNWPSCRCTAKRVRARS
jgi:hypothetical protein